MSAVPKTGLARLAADDADGDTVLIQYECPECDHAKDREWASIDKHDQSSVHCNACGTLIKESGTNDAESLADDDIPDWAGVVVVALVMIGWVILVFFTSDIFYEFMGQLARLFWELLT